MNKKLGMISSLVNCITVILFALFMLISFSWGSYLVCMFLALSFVVMISSFAQECEEDRKAAAYAAMIFAGCYAVMILLVYFAQTTSVRWDGLSDETLRVIDYSKSGLFFNFDLLGYGLMALATFFAGLTIKAECKVDKWLKWLLIIHGVFFISCLILPMTGMMSNSSESGYWAGVIALEFWCLYFTPIGILSFIHFKKGMF